MNNIVFQGLFILMVPGTKISHYPNIWQNYDNVLNTALWKVIPVYSKRAGQTLAKRMGHTDTYVYG